MRSHLITAALAAGLLLAAPAPAQESYVVEEGDSLWSIADEMYGSPWLWPKLWEANAFIDNPHRIFPGELLTLVPADQMQPAAPGTGLPVVKLEGPGRDEAAPFDATAADADFRDMGVTVPAQRVEVGLNFSPAFQEGFMSAEAVDSSGALTGGTSDKVHFSVPDVVYINVGADVGVRKGERFTIFRVQHPVEHPQDKRVAGYLVEIIGVLEVRAVRDDSATAVVVDSFKGAKRGDRLTPFEEVDTEVRYTETPPGLDGTILVAKDGPGTFAQQNVVYIDLGEEDGVVPGNRFDVYLPGRQDKKSKRVDRIREPPRVIGELVVVKTRPHHSTALVTRSVQEFGPGERVRSYTGPVTEPR